MIIYLIDVLANVGMVVILSLLLFSIGIVVTIAEGLEYNKKLITAFIISLLLSIVLPSKNTIYLMYGEHLAKQVANSDEGKVILDKMLKIINNKLDEQLDKGKND